MNTQVVRLLDPEQSASQPRIIKIEFRSFDQPLSKICVVRLQQENDIARFQYRQPLSCCGVRDP